MLKIYHYDPNTLGYLETTKARMSPLDGVVLVPAHATRIAPPAAENGQVPAFIDGQWALVPNNIGEKFWLPDGTPGVIKRLGDTVPKAALSEPPDLRTEDEKREDQIRAIKSEAAKRIDQFAPVWKQLNAWRENGGDDPIFAEIDSIRKVSNELENMNPIPEDVTDNRLWDVKAKSAPALG